MKALIVGAAGFVGNYLIAQCRDHCGFKVHVTKMPQETLREGCDGVHDLNLLDPEATFQLLEHLRPDYIFHLAAQSSVALSWKNPGLTIDVNVKGSVNLLDAIRRLDYSPRTLLIGSGEEYGHIRPNESPINEENCPRPGNIYAATKVCQNMIAKIYTDAYHMNNIMVRAFNHIGPNQAPLFVVADFCRQVALIEQGKQEPVIRVGNLSAMRDFTDVRDVVKAYTLLIQHGTPGETYNVGSGKAVPIQYILDQILNLSTVPITIETDPAKLRPVDVPIIEADTKKIREATGWTPQIPLMQTLNETLEYWRQAQ